MSMGAGGSEAFTEINVTPLTDVFLVLLVIMIIIAPLIDSSELKIKPPKTINAKKADESKCITIDIDKTGKIAINGHLIKNPDSNELATCIEKVQKTSHKKDIPVTLNADGECQNSVIMQVMAAARESGIKHMRIATRQAGADQQQQQ